MKSIAIVPSPAPLSELYLAFLDDLSIAGFRGEISRDYGMRTVLSTDNSIYQWLPQAAVYPCDAEDLERLARLMHDPRYRSVVVTARGGGTGTNGQSLTSGIVVDLSRHMNRILEIDVARRRVRVEAGVVKDQLNAALKPHGLFFAPELSTSNRATIGGMISTDASGQGSCTYGKTRDHVLALDCVLPGGEWLTSVGLDNQQLLDRCKQESAAGRAYRVVEKIAREKADEIEHRFPKLNRCLTGYDLAHLREPDGKFNLNSILCGSEGSLAFVASATLNVLPIPRCTSLVNIRYSSFMDALRDARALMEHQPLSIETVDSRVLSLAMQDIVWQSVSPYFPADGERETRGINLVEFCGDDEQQVAARVEAFTRYLAEDKSSARIGYTVAAGREAVETVYAMRKRAVGILGNVEGEARPQPFVEDTAVPPENLADYISEFRAVLDRHGLQYGMFGHVDAGVLHVRPALDMKDPAQAALVRPISDAVAQLTRKYGGVLWGEHGKGLRSEYSPAYFGGLYASLQEIKAAFDPYNQLNPGKIATAAGGGKPLLRLDEVATRGSLDSQIDRKVWQSFGAAMHCNGNGACYNYDPDDVMCPSWKATRERVHSPKGRASLMREWLRLQGAAGVDVLQVQDSRQPFFKSLLFRWNNSRRRRTGADTDFSHQVYDAMAGCLACKSCVSQCPVKVNVPEFRSRFLSLYHTRYLRPIKDYLIGSLEYTIPYFSMMPRTYNAVMNFSPVRSWLERHAGIVDSPQLSRYNWREAMRRWGAEEATPERLAALDKEQRNKSVIVVLDAFTRYFETQVPATFIELAVRLGYTVYVAPFSPNGKPLHVQGFLQAFERTARRNESRLAALSSYGVPLVGLDPAMTLAYRQEYRKSLGGMAGFDVLLPQEWLLMSAPVSSPARENGRYRLLAHCTEKTSVPASTHQWQEIFQRFGLQLEIQASNCCGMSGTYGHETRNLENSKRIFAQSWGPLLDQTKPDTETLATGYSCRSQVKRLREQPMRHPVEVLAEHLRANRPTKDCNGQD